MEDILNNPKLLKSRDIKILNKRLILVKKPLEGIGEFEYRLFDAQTKTLLAENLRSFVPIFFEFNKQNIGIGSDYENKHYFFKLNDEGAYPKLDIIPTDFNFLTLPNEEGFSVAFQKEVDEKTGREKQKEMLVRFVDGDYQVVSTIRSTHRYVGQNGRVLILQNKKDGDFCFAKFDETGIDYYYNVYKNIEFTDEERAVVVKKTGEYTFLDFKDNKVFEYPEEFKFAEIVSPNYAKACRKNGKDFLYFLDGIFSKEVNQDFDHFMGIMGDDYACVYNLVSQGVFDFSIIDLKTGKKVKNSEGKEVFPKLKLLAENFAYVVDKNHYEMNLAFLKDGEMIVNPTPLSECGNPENGGVNIIDTYGKPDYAVLNPDKFGEKEGLKKANLKIRKAEPLHKGFAVAQNEFYKYIYVKFENGEFQVLPNSWYECKPFKKGFGVCMGVENLYYVVDKTGQPIEVELDLRKTQSKFANKKSLTENIQKDLGEEKI